ncbi:MAG: DUF3362 domain-containing protein, partial [Gammaproteobacteria bacterium]
REALQRMGRADLIGNGQRHLVPSWQPAGTGKKTSPDGAKSAPAGRIRRPAATRSRRT